MNCTREFILNQMIEKQMNICHRDLTKHYTQYQMDLEAYEGMINYPHIFVLKLIIAIYIIYLFFWCGLHGK
jgi:hypothetical protein